MRVVLISFLLCVGMLNSQAQPLNVVLVMADDLGWYDVGFNGNDMIKTPHLDEMASKGIVFDRFYSASPVCSPTRASMLIGRHPHLQGVFHANVGHLKEKEITIAEMLKEQGYATRLFGKWHLGTLTTMTHDANCGQPGNDEHYSIPTMRGFDKYFCTESKAPTFDTLYYLMKKKAKGSGGLSSIKTAPKHLSYMT